MRNEEFQNSEEAPEEDEQGAKIHQNNPEEGFQYFGPAQPFVALSRVHSLEGTEMESDQTNSWMTMFVIKTP